MPKKIDKCPNSQVNLANCPCTYQACPRHGLCCECIRYHRQRKELPACYFTPEEEKTYNRSLQFYVQRHLNK